MARKASQFFQGIMKRSQDFSLWPLYTLPFLVLFLSPDVDWCIAPHHKRKILKDPNHDKGALLNDVHLVTLRRPDYFARGGKIESRLLKFCQSHAAALFGMAKCDLAKFKQPAVTFCLLVKIFRPRQCQLRYNPGNHTKRESTPNLS